jgi:hypothetical protein
MVDFKVFTAAVIVVTAFLVVALSSLAANEEADQYSAAAVQYSAAVVGNEQMVAVVDDARDIPEAVDLSGEHLPLMVRWILMRRSKKC